jgi:hypothetical protein
MEMTTNPLNWGPISLVRRNHGLEHATLNLLSELYPQKSFAGYSDTKGFWVVGDISTDVLFSVVNQALDRLRGGERNLAIHANCGTNFVTSGVVAGTLAWLGTLGNARSFRKKINRWSYLVMLVTGALILSKPLGPIVQEKFTTSGDPLDLAVSQITRYDRNGPALHHIRTAVHQAAAPAAAVSEE